MNDSIELVHKFQKNKRTKPKLNYERNGFTLSSAMHQKQD